MKICKKVIKILFVSNSSELAGAERMLLLLLKNINRERFEPIVILPKSGPLEEKMRHLNIKTYKVNSPWWAREQIDIFRFIYCIILEILALFKFYWIVRQEKVDLVYTNTITKFSGAIIALITKKSHIWHITEIIPANPNLRFFLPCYKTIFGLIKRLSHTLIANSHATASQFQNIESSKKLKVIYNSVDIDIFKKNTSSPNINKVTSKDWLVAVVGTLQERKAQDDAIRAVKIAKKVIPNIKLILIGDGRRKYKHYLKKIASKLDILDKVIFTGYRDDVAEILPHCKVLLVPSWNEPFGCVILEAMVAGIPVIGVNRGGVREIIIENITGCLVPPKNPCKIAEKIIYLFHNPNIAESMGNAGEKTVKEKFSIQNYIQKIEKVIYEAINVA